MNTETEIKKLNKHCAETTAMFDKRTALMQQDIKNIINKQDDILKKLDNFDMKFVSKTEFWPVKTIVYSLVGTILLAVVGAIVALILK